MALSKWPKTVGSRIVSKAECESQELSATVRFEAHTDTSVWQVPGPCGEGIVVLDRGGDRIGRGYGIGHGYEPPAAVAGVARALRLTPGGTSLAIFTTSQ